MSLARTNTVILAILVVCMLSVTATGVYAASESNGTTTEEGDYKYYVEGGEAAVLGFATGKSVTNVVIPATLSDKTPITAIRYNAFDSQSTITSVTLGNNVTSIESYAFKSCTALKTINLTKITKIGVDAFKDCVLLVGTDETDKILDLSSITDDGWDNYTFRGCKALVNVNLNQNVTKIPVGTFSTCDKLASINFPSGLTTIGDNAFFYCFKLSNTGGSDKELKIPKSVTTIGKEAFKDVQSMNTLTFETGSKLTTIGESAFARDHTAGYYTSFTGSIVIPSTVSSIGSMAFEMNSKVTSISFGDNTVLKTIGDKVFSGCSKITEIKIPKNIKSIGSHAFYMCTGLATVDFSACTSLKTIGDNAFNGCTGLAGTMSIPSTVESIGNYAFTGCKSITGLEFKGNSVKTIGTDAFKECTSLTGTLTIPASVESIGDYAFRDTAFTELKFANGCELAAIGNGVFQGNASIGNYVVLPSKITSIGDYAFQNCKKMTGIQLNEGLKSIGSNAFNGCTGLTKIVIPSSLEKLGDSAFGTIKFHVSGNEVSPTAENLRGHTFTGDYKDMRYGNVNPFSTEMIIAIVIIVIIALLIALGYYYYRKKQGQ